MGYAEKKELVRKARTLRNNMTLAEILLWSKIRSKKIEGYRFRRQHPIYNYVVDFYCEELKLIIEVDGEIHSLTDKSDSDIKRDKILKVNGYSLLRFSNYEIKANIEAVVRKIKTYINTPLSPSQGDHRGL